MMNKKSDNYLFFGTWKNPISDFVLLNNAGVIKIEDGPIEIDINKKIIRIKKENIKENYKEDLIIEGRKCPVCKSKTILGYWIDYLPLLINKDLNQSLLISDIGSKKNVVEYCRNCNLFVCKDKEFEIIEGEEKDVHKKVKDKIKAREVYFNSIKKGTLIGGSISTLLYYIFLSFKLFKEVLPDLGFVLGLLFSFIVVPISAFLIGVPFGAGIGAGVGRRKNKKQGRPEY